MAEYAVVAALPHLQSAVCDARLPAIARKTILVASGLPAGHVTRSYLWR